MISGSTKKTLFRIIQTGLMLAFLGWKPIATAGEFDISTLMDLLAHRSSGQATFVEHKFLSVLDKPIEQNGTLAFSPGRLEKVTLLPQMERMLVEGDVLTIETGVDKRKRRLRLTRFPSVQGFIEGLRATLTGDLPTLRRFYDVGLQGTAGQWRLILTPSQSDMAASVRQISIAGMGGSINLIEIQHKGGDRSVMRISEVVS